MPYILNTPEDIKEMLKAVGVRSLEDLYAQLPAPIKLKAPLNLPCGLSEYEVRKIVEDIAKKNRPLNRYNSFLGAGCYDHYLPSPLKFITSCSEFTTAYTPYQAECSQGILQALYEYQSYICLLTGMEISNASLFDGASSLAEAVLMSLRITKRIKVIISEAIHPDYRQTLRTYLEGRDFIIQKVSFGRDGRLDLDNLRKMIDKDTACLAFQLPNFFGLIEESKKIGKIVREKEALVIAVANPFSLALLKEPAEAGVDIVCGDGQPLGGGLNFGGSSLGFLAARGAYLRQMPGRIVGKTTDKEGRLSYCLTLQAREQHIRREKATSNICSNHSLNAIAFAVYLSLMGREEFKKAALYSLNLAHYLFGKLKEIRAVRLPFSPCFFNEFVWEVPDAKKLIDKLYERRIIAGFYLGDFYPSLKNSILSCCTEKKSKDDIDSFIQALQEIIS